MWIETKEHGWVNLDHAARVTRVKDGYAIYGRDGERVGIAGDHTDLEEWISDTIVAASAGQEAAVFWCYDEDGVIAVEFQRAAVVAWRVGSLGAFPIVAGESPSSNERIMILHPDGRVADPFNCEWKTVAEATASIRADMEEAKRRRGEDGSNG